MTSFLPYEEIELVLTSKKKELDAIIATLPCHPVMVPVPKLLPVMTGDTWGSKDIISHDLLRIYCATVFYLESLGRTGTHWKEVGVAMQHAQQKVYDDYAFDDVNFTLHYINAYEIAIIKYLHIFKVGEDVSLEPNKDGSPPISYFIFNMTNETIKELKFHELITTTILDERPKRLNDYATTLSELQEKLELTTLI